MPLPFLLRLVLFLIIGGGFAVQADERIIDDFANDPQNRWTYVADTVMGGVSRGDVQIGVEQGDAFLRMTGTVSTDNNGGFIQFRRQLAEPLPKNAKGVRLRVRGNGERYFVHLRTKSNRLPWSYYQAGFDTTENWTEVRLPFSGFEASGRLMRKSISVEGLVSVGVVAFGRDHSALIDVSEIGFY